MRSFTTAVQNEINSDLLKYFFLIELEFKHFNLNTNQYDTTDYYFTSFHRNITWPLTNGNLYTSDGGLFEFETPSFSSVVDREAYKIVISDKDDIFSGHFKAGVVGSPIKVHVGIIEGSTGNPLLGDNDILQLYTGFVDSPAIDNDFETKLAVIEGTSPMADLDQINVRMVSRDGMDQLDSTDTSYDKLYDDSEIHLKWGKA